MNDEYVDDANDSIYPACVFNDWGVSKTFLIIFKNEEIQLDDQFNFKLSVIVDAQTVRIDCTSQGFDIMHRSLNVSIDWICNCIWNYIFLKKIIRKSDIVCGSEEKSEGNLDRKKCHPCNSYAVDRINFILILDWVFILIYLFSLIIFIYRH